MMAQIAYLVMQPSTGKLVGLAVFVLMGTMMMETSYANPATTVVSHAPLSQLVTVVIALLEIFPIWLSAVA